MIGQARRRRATWSRSAVCTALAVVAGCGASSGPVATLGHPAGIFGRNSIGLGHVRPKTISNGGDPTGIVTHLVWKSWGGGRAIGTGTSDYVTGNESVAAGTEEAVTVVAFNLGTCHDVLMYRAVEWFFPQHGQGFDQQNYENICTGSYVSATK